MASNKQDIQHTLVSYFVNIYKRAQQSDWYWDELNELEEVVLKLSQQKMVNLQAPIIKEEVKNIVFQMGGLKALGVDGILAKFYQIFWPEV